MMTGQDPQPPRDDSPADLGTFDVPALLTLTPIGDDRFAAERAQGTFYGSLYGGQLLGQALAAAAATVEFRPAHSMHGYFLRAGRPDLPLLYQVERVRDGRAFSTRRVQAIQAGQPIFTMDCSFRLPEPGWEHQATPPVVPPPELLEPIRVFTHAIDPALAQRIAGHYAGDNPIDLRPVAGGGALLQQQDSRRQAWLRVPSLAGHDAPALHQAALAWLSDFWVSSAALVMHRHPLPGPDLLLASIDHAIWFHRPARADGWLLYDTDSPSASSGTGLTRGQIYDRDGRLIATVMQEILQRSRIASATG